MKASYLTSSWTKPTTSLGVVIVTMISMSIPGIILPVYGQWEKHIIGNYQTHNIPDLIAVNRVCVVDIDDDHDLDVIATDPALNGIYYFENKNLLWSSSV